MSTPTINVFRTHFEVVEVDDEAAAYLPRECIVGKVAFTFGGSYFRFEKTDLPLIEQLLARFAAFTA